MPRFTPAQYDDFLARRRSHSPSEPPATTEHGGEAGTEGALHEKILRFCRDNAWIAFHGSMAHRAMRTMGEPDFIILALGRIYLIECKTRTGKLSNEQLGIQQWAARLGHTVHLVRSYQEFLQLIRSPRLTEPSKSGAGPTETSP